MGELEATWTASPVDGSHEAPAYYEVWVSGDPSGGFTVADTSTTTTVQRQLAPTTEFCLVVAVNSAGTSGDERAP